MGNDTYVVDNTSDKIIENANEGTDTVQSTASNYALNNNLESLTLTGTGLINGTGNSLNNILTGNSASNTLTGGKGNDTLMGGEGDDTYVYNFSYTLDAAGKPTTRLASADGVDAIIENDSVTTNQDTLRFNTNAAIDFAKVLTRNTKDLIFTINSSNKIVIQDFFLDANKRIEFVEYTDPTTKQLIKKSISELTPKVYIGTAGVDTIKGWEGIDNIDGHLGNDTIYGYGGNDILFGHNDADYLDGGIGDDSLEGGYGNDTLIGGHGNDKITDKGGSDLYIYSTNDGIDTITDIAAKDTLKLTDINADQLWFQHQGNNLTISKIGTSDKITITDWYLQTATKNTHIETFKSGNNKTLLDTSVENLVQAMAGFELPSIGTTTLPSNYQTALNAIIAASWK